MVQNSALQIVVRFNHGQWGRIFESLRKIRDLFEKSKSNAKKSRVLLSHWDALEMWDPDLHEGCLFLRPSQPWQRRESKMLLKCWLKCWFWVSKKPDIYNENRELPSDPWFLKYRSGTISTSITQELLKRQSLTLHPIPTESETLGAVCRFPSSPDGPNKVQV